MSGAPEPTADELEWLHADPEHVLVVGDRMVVNTPKGATPFGYLELADPEVSRLMEGRKDTPAFVLNWRIRANPVLEERQKSMARSMQDGIGDEGGDGGDP